MKKPQVDTPYKNSWADRMAQGFYKGTKVPQPSDHWVILPGKGREVGSSMMKTIGKFAKEIALKTPSEAAKALRKLYKERGADFVQDVLMVLQDSNNDQWWLDMMFDAGEDISKLY